MHRRRFVVSLEPFARVLIRAQNGSLLSHFDSLHTLIHCAVELCTRRLDPALIQVQWVLTP